MSPPFEPMNMASLADMTRKLAFLLPLASAKRNSEVWAFRAVVRFGQIVVSAKSVWLKTMDPSKPETFMHLSRSITPIYGRGSPCQVFCAPSKRAQRYYLKLSINGQHPNNKFRRLLCAFNWAHRLYIQEDGVGVDQTSDHTRLTRRVRMRIFLT